MSYWLSQAYALIFQLVVAESALSKEVSANDDLN